MKKEQLALEIMGLYPEDVRFVYHHFPRMSSEFSVILAESMEAAGAQGRFWELHNQFLINAPSDNGELLAVAEAAELDMDQFIYDVEYGKYLPVVISAIEKANEHGVEHSSLFINDKEFTDEPTFDNLLIEIERELE